MGLTTGGGGSSFFQRLTSFLAGVGLTSMVGFYFVVQEVQRYVGRLSLAGVLLAAVPWCGRLCSDVALLVRLPAAYIRSTDLAKASLEDLAKKVEESKKK